ncbi:MAG: CBS domain-containing protein [Phycisphaerae bacterium]|nr:CBS domain-containing protein [Phycisphaerae bacterium]
MIVKKPVTAIIKEGHGVLSVDADATVLMACKKMRYHNVGSLVVISEKGAPSGIVTERDLLNKVLAEEKDPRDMIVRDVMTDGVVSIDSLVSIPEAQIVMARHSIRHLPIIEDGLLLGMISIRDIFAHQLAAVKSLLRQQANPPENLDEEFPDLPE